MCVGEGGMSPEYFKHTLTFWEAVLFAQGVQRRYRTQWHAARYISFYAAKPHCKDLDWDKMGKFVWEKEDEPPIDPQEEARDLAALRARAQERDEELNKLKKEEKHGER